MNLGLAPEVPEETVISFHTAPGHVITLPTERGGVLSLTGDARLGVAWRGEAWVGPFGESRGASTFCSPA